MIKGVKVKPPPVPGGEIMGVGENICVSDLDEGSQYKFLGVLETVRQEERMSLECATKKKYQGYKVKQYNMIMDVLGGW